MFRGRSLRITKTREVLQTQLVEEILYGISEDIGNDLSEEIAKHRTRTDLRDWDILLDGGRYSRRGHGSSLVVGRFGWRGLEWVRLGVKNVCSIQCPSALRGVGLTLATHNYQG